jgi:flagellar hook-basal body complex protein FliE
MSEFQINGIPFPNPVVKTKPDEVRPGKATVPQTGPSFGEVLQNAIQQVSDLHHEAGIESQKLMTGNSHDIHSAMVAIQKADVSFQMMMQVRNKIVSAYQEIMRTQV